MEEEKKYQMKDSTYYSRIVMMIVNSIQLILFIVFIVFTHTIRDDMREVNKSVGYSRIEYDFVFDEQTQGVDTCFAFFIISFVFFYLNLFGISPVKIAIITMIFSKIFLEIGII